MSRSVMLNAAALVLTLLAAARVEAAAVDSALAASVPPPRDSLTANDLAEGYGAVNNNYSRGRALDKGIAAYERFLSQHEVHYDARMGLAQLLSWTGRYEQASLQYERILKDFPGNPDARVGLAQNLSWSREWARAADVLRGLLSEDRANAQAHLMLARILSWQGEYRESSEHAQIALKAEHGVAQALDVLAKNCFWQRRWRCAREYFTSIVNRHEPPEVLYDAEYHLAEIEWRLGNTREARVRLERLARSVYPDERAPKKLSEIRDFLRPSIRAEAFRYQEFGYGEQRGGYESGLGNNSLGLRFEKNIDAAWEAIVHYQVRNETTDLYFVTKQPRASDVGVHDGRLALRRRHRSEGQTEFYYHPLYLWDLGKGRLGLTRNGIFHGAGIEGSLRLGGVRVQYGYERRPLMLRYADSLGVRGTHAATLGCRFSVFGGVDLAPAASAEFPEDGNRKLTGRLEVSKPFRIRNARLTGLASFTQFKDTCPEYLTYRWWFFAEAGPAWDELRPFPRIRGQFMLPLDLRLGFHALTMRDSTDYFGGVRAKMTPTYVLTRRQTIALALDMFLSTRLYFVYYAGLQYVLHL